MTIEKNLKRLAHIATEYKPITGGAQTYLANLHTTLADAGWEQTVYQFDNGVYDEGLKLISHAPDFLKGGRALDLWWFNLLLLSKFNSLREREIIISHYAFHSWPLFWRKKVIVLSHGCEWDIPPTSLSQKLKIKISRWSFNHFKYLVANDTNYFRQMGIDIKPKEKMFQEIIPGKWFIPNCVDNTVFKPTEPYSGFPPHPLLVVRNMSHARGIHLAIQAFALFVKDFPKTNLVLIGGCSDNNYREKLDQIIQTNDLTNKVHFAGSIGWSKMPAVYSAGELNIVPTLQREGTSLAALEAMACGIATVSTNVHGLADLPTVQSNPTPESLAQEMRKTYKDRKEIAAKQQQEVKSTYNLTNWKNAWLKVVRHASG